MQLTELRLIQSPLITCFFPSKCPLKTSIGFQPVPSAFKYGVKSMSLATSKYPEV